MKYNKQLFDHINDQYNQVFSISEFIYDQLIEKTEDLNRFEIMSNLDLYIQGLLAKIVLTNDPKNPALFNMLKKLNKYDTFYKGINLDDWFNQKEKVLTKKGKEKAKKERTNEDSADRIRQDGARHRADSPGARP